MQLRRGNTRYKHFLLACFYACLMSALTLWTFKRGEFELTVLNAIGLAGFVWISARIRKVIEVKEESNSVKRFTRPELLTRINQIESDFEKTQEDLTSDYARGYAAAVRDIKTRSFNMKNTQL